MAYGRLSIVPNELFDEAIVTVMTRVPEPDRSIPAINEPGLIGLRRTIFRGSVGDDYGKRLRWQTETHMQDLVTGREFSRNQLLNESVTVFENRSDATTDILHEYFIPAESFVEFVSARVAEEALARIDVEYVNQRGEWVDVPLIDGTLIMNIGDMMEILSNGRYAATRHRVKKVAQERYAFALFHALDYDTVVAPIPRGEAPRYAPLSGGEHLFTRTAQTFAYLKQRVSDGELVLADSAPVEAFGLVEGRGRHRPDL